MTLNDFADRLRRVVDELPDELTEEGEVWDIEARTYVSSKVYFIARCFKKDGKPSSGPPIYFSVSLED